MLCCICTFVMMLHETGLPSSPQNLHVVDTDSGRISLEWKPSIETATATVDEYIIEMAEGDSKNFVEVVKVDGGICKFDATGLKDGQKYNFRVKAKNGAGTSNSTQLKSPVTASAAPSGERKGMKFTAA